MTNSATCARGGKVDYLGIILLVLSLASLQIVLDRGQRADWFAAPWVIYATGIAALSFILLIVRELSFGEPIVDPLSDDHARSPSRPARPTW